MLTETSTNNVIISNNNFNSSGGAAGLRITSINGGTRFSGNYGDGWSVSYFTNAVPSPVQISGADLAGRPLSNVSTISSYNGTNTAGNGVPAIYGSSRKMETAADANVLTFTPPATFGQYRINFVLSLSAANTATLGWTATWKDSSGNAQAPTNLSLLQQGTAAPALTFTTSAAGNYYGSAIIDVDDSAAAS